MSRYAIITIGNSATEIINIGSMELHKVVEKMQRNYKKVYGIYPSATYKMAESNDFVGALIESV